MERAIQIYVIINLLVIGISHLLQAEAWVNFFKLLSSYGRSGAFLNGFLSLAFGSIVTAFHWNWDGVLPTLVTCMGIAQIIKGLIAFAAPQLALKSMSSSKAQDKRSYQIGGVLFLIFAGFLAYHVWG